MFPVLGQGPSVNINLFVPSSCRPGRLTNKYGVHACTYTIIVLLCDSASRMDLGRLLVVHLDVLVNVKFLDSHRKVSWCCSSPENDELPIHRQYSAWSQKFATGISPSASSFPLLSTPQVSNLRLSPHLQALWTPLPLQFPPIPTPPSASPRSWSAYAQRADESARAIRLPVSVFVWLQMLELLIFVVRSTVRVNVLDWRRSRSI